MGEPIAAVATMTGDERLHRCIEDLGRNGIDLTIEQQLRIQAVFVAACVGGGGVPAGERLAAFIAPIAASNPEEQVTCHAVVASWFPQAARADEPVPPHVVPAPVDDEPGGAAEAALADASQRERLRRLRNIVGSAAIVLAATYVVALFLLAHFGSHRPAAAKPSAASPVPSATVPLAPKLFTQLSANIKGTISGKSISFTKTYDGTGGVNHSVAYRGTISPDGRSMSGMWSIPQTAPQPELDGTFSATATAGSASEWQGSYSYPAALKQPPVPFTMVLHTSGQSISGTLNEQQTFGDSSAPVETISSQSGQGWLGGLQSRFGALAALVVMIPLLVLVVVTYSSRRLLAAYARQARVIPRSEIRVLLANEAVRLEPDEPFLRRVQTLRRRVETYSRELDIKGTLNATAARGGILTPVAAKGYVTPEYLVLIDERGPEDHLSAYSAALVKALGQAGVGATVYRFDRDPRRVYLGRGQRAVDIRDLVALFGTNRLFVFSDGVGWMDPATGRPQPWAHIFSEWEHRFLFTWKDRKDWSSAEIAFERQLGFAVLPATQEGLTIAAETFEREGRTASANGGPRLAGRESWRLADTFAVGRWRWLDSHAPPTTEARDLVWRLREELSAPAFTWLCAIAVYPGISWSLTIFLGARLTADGPFDDAWRMALLEIARLPWLHAGRMPRWLRELLIEELDADRRALVYDALESLFLTETAAARGIDALQLVHNIGPGASAPRDPLDRDGAARDYILIDFLARGKATSADFRLRGAVLRNLGLTPSQTQRIVFGRDDLIAARASADALRAFVALTPPAAVAARTRANGNFGIAVADVEAWADESGGAVALPAALALLDDDPKGRALRVVDERTASVWSRRKRFTVGIAALGPLAFLIALALGHADYFRRSSDAVSMTADFLAELPALCALFYAPAVLAWLSVYLPMLREIRRFPQIAPALVRSAESAPVRATGNVPRSARFAAIPAGIAAAVLGSVWLLATLLPLAPAPSMLVLSGHTGPVNSAVFSPDGRRVVSASADETVRIWEATRGTEIAILRGSGSVGVASAAAFSTDGRRVVSAWGDDSVRIFDAASDAQLLVLRGHESAVNSAAFSPDGKRVVSASQDGTVSVWDAASGKPLERFLGTTHGPVFSAVFSPDGQRVVSATDDGQVVIWDVASGRGTAYHVHTGAVMDAAYSPDGGRIVSASADDTVQILNTHGAQVAVLRGHKGAVNSASFSPDGRRIVSASSDQTVRVWDSASGTQLAMFEGDAPFNWAGYSPDQRRIVSASADGTVRIWDAAAAGNVPAPFNANTPAPAPQRSLASEWQGKYMYAPGDTRSPVPFTWVLHVKGTSITGREDEINTFGDKSAPKLGASLVGTINGASVAIEKTYNGTGGVNHSVAYQGTISPDERSMSGIWTIGPTAGSFSVTATGK